MIHSPMPYSSRLSISRILSSSRAVEQSSSRPWCSFAHSHTPAGGRTGEGRVECERRCPAGSRCDVSTGGRPTQGPRDGLPTEWCPGGPRERSSSSAKSNNCACGRPSAAAVACRFDSPVHPHPIHHILICYPPRRLLLRHLPESTSSKPHSPKQIEQPQAARPAAPPKPMPPWHLKNNTLSAPS